MDMIIHKYSFFQQFGGKVKVIPIAGGLSHFSTQGYQRSLPVYFSLFSLLTSMLICR